MPSAGNELTSRYPAVVLSTNDYTDITGLVAVSPIIHARNNRLKEFFIPITGKSIAGYINPLQFFTYYITKRHLKFTGEVLGDLAFSQLIETHVNS